MSGFAVQFGWARTYTPAIRTILAENMIREATPTEDQLEATDFIVFQAIGGRIAARVRKLETSGRYADEFTIRSRSISGVATEYDKICEGWGDYLFYGIAHASNVSFNRWTIIDLKAFRQHLMLAHRNGNEIPFKEIQNRDGSAFMAFRIPEFPEHPRLVHAKSW